MKPFWKIFLVIFVLAGGGFYWWTKQSGGKPGEAAPVAKSGGKTDGKAPGKRGGGPINVTAVKTVRAPMPVVIDAVGSVESEHSVAVRPQVNGTLTAVTFKEGDYVKQGQVLFRVDPRSAQAAVDQRKAIGKDIGRPVHQTDRRERNVVGGIARQSLAVGVRMCRHGLLRRAEPWR